MMKICIGFQILAGMAFHETRVELQNVNVCCATCEKLALKTLEKGGVKGSADARTFTATSTAADDRAGQGVLDALAAEGLHGDMGRKDRVFRDDRGVGAGKLSSLTLATHHCCPQCSKRLKAVIAAVEGVASDDAKPRVPSFTVTGSFDGMALVKAINGASFHAKAVPADGQAPPAPPAWDGKESVREYAARAGLPESETLDLGNGVRLEMTLVPAGSFLMGSPAGEARPPQAEGAEKQHRVTLSAPFYLGRYELTQAQYVAVMGSNPSATQDPKLAVTDLTWADAAAFCAKASEFLKRDLRLPTEAQWEFACRAGSGTAFYTGNDEADLDKAGWYSKNSGKKLHVGGEKAPNAFGLYDMLGNVREFCRDYFAPYDGKEAVDPAGPETGEQRVSRGGAFPAVTALLCRCANRTPEPPARKNAIIGLRPMMAVAAK
jgi:formylglycine-generating enzyme required for sulfatase activity